MKPKKSKRAVWIPVLVLLLITVLIAAIWGYAHYQEQKRRILETDITAEHSAIRLQEYVSVRLNLVGQMKGLWRRGLINTPESFADHALSIQEQFSGMLAINWIDPQGFIRWVVPEEPNRAAKDKDLHEHSGAASTFIEAEKTQTIQITPPLNLLQGGHGIAAYFPLDVDGRNQGYLNAVFRLESMIEDCLSQGIKNYFDFVIRDGRNLVYATTEPDKVLDHPMVVAKDLEIGGRTWSMAFAPTEMPLWKSLKTDLIWIGVGLMLALVLTWVLRRMILRGEAIRRSESMFHAIFDQTFQYIGLMTPDGKLLEVNRTALDVVGATESRVVGKFFWDTPLWSHSPEEQQRMKKAVKDAADGHFVRFEAEMSGRQSKVRYIDFSLKPVKDERGNITMLLPEGRDITEHKKADLALKESEERYRTIFETTGTATIIFGEDSIITLANDEFAKLTGYSREQIENSMTWMDFATESSLATMNAYHVRRAEDPDSVPGSYETKIKDSAGDEHYGILAINMVPGTKQRVASFLDLTERKRTEQQMFRAEKMAALGQIIAGVAHEINNPNNFIYFNLPILKRYVEAIKPLLDENAANDPELKILNMPYEYFLEDIFKLLENMQHGSERITSIVSELRSYIRSHEVEDFKPESLPPLVDHVMTLVGKQVKKMVKRFDVRMAQDLPQVPMNMGRMEQVLINLIINAGQAADKEDSWVLLNIDLPQDSPGFVRIRVEDNGSGMTEDVIGKIFDPFFTTKGREAGTGLGLAISQRIIEEHGGRISVSSTPGKGTCFTVLLPTQRNDT